jgi:1,4-alpha-glucan branching enzyme
MQNRCGGWQVNDDENEGEVSFRLFFPPEPDPEIREIRVAGSFQAALGGVNWDFPGGLPLRRRVSADPPGTFWEATTGTSLRAGFYEYKYLVAFADNSSRIVSDPCTRYSGLSNQNAAIVVGGSRPADNVITPLANGRKPLADLNVYELMIDDFTDEFRGKRAPLAAVIDRLDYLRDLGFNAILFMPWTAWKNQAFDWGYEPLQYFAIESRYANDLDQPAEKLSWLKRLVNECHARDIHVIMDGVFNHASVDFPYKALYRNPETCPYTGEFGGMFPGLQDLDFDNACTGEFILDACLYWIRTFGIDGIRFDNTVNYYLPGDIRGLGELLRGIQGSLAEQRQTNFSLTLEHLDLSAATVTDTTPATSFWDNSLWALCFEYLWNGRIDSRLLNTLNNRRWLRNPGKLPTLYLSNHDHSHVGWQVGARDNQGATARWYKAQPFVIALFTSTATPLVRNGEEFIEDHFIPENDYGTGRRVVRRPLRWKETADQPGLALLRLYRVMARMRRDHPGLRSGRMYPDSWEEWQTRLNPVGVGIDVDRQLMTYHRWEEFPDGSVENFVIVLNFSDADQVVTVPFPINGRWMDLLSGLAGTWSPMVENNQLMFTARSNWGHVFRKT